jgi:hypothetical protein
MEVEKQNNEWQKNAVASEQVWVAAARTFAGGVYYK